MFAESAREFRSPSFVSGAAISSYFLLISDPAL